MKKVIFALCLLFAIVSCSNENKLKSNESKMKSGIKDYFEKNANDPKSYEFVDLKITDTLTLGEVANQNIEVIDKSIKDNIEFLKDRKKFEAEYPNPDAKMDFASYEEIIKYDKKSKELFEKFSNSTEIVLYKVSHKYRLKNEFGAIILLTNDFVFDKDFIVVDMAKKDKPIIDIINMYCYKNYFLKK